MLSTGLGSQTAGWLVENGPRELELLFRAIVYHPSAPILLTDDKGNSRDASFGVGRILGIPREQIIGHSIDEFALPAFKPKVSQLFAALPEKGELEGSLGLLGSNGTAKHVAFAAKANVLPVRHLLVLHEKAVAEAPADSEAAQADAPPPWVKDFALFLLDVDGLIVAWYAGAERIYGYPAEKVIGKHVSCVYSPDAAARGEVEDKLKRAVVEGHLGSEGWHVKSDGERFWANVIIMALRRDDGTLQGFASIVRDFSGRHEQDEKIRRNRARTRLSPLQSTIAGVVSGEFDRIPEANDTFLELVGYSREDLKSGLLQWPELTPRNLRRWMNSRTRKDCGLGPARLTRRNWSARTAGVYRCWWPQPCSSSPLPLDLLCTGPAGARPAGERRRGNHCANTGFRRNRWYEYWP